MIQAGDEVYFSNDKQTWIKAEMLYVDHKPNDDSRFVSDGKGRFKYAKKSEKGNIYSA